MRRGYDVTKRKEQRRIRGEEAEARQSEPKDGESREYQGVLRGEARRGEERYNEVW